MKFVGFFIFILFFFLLAPQHAQASTLSISPGSSSLGIGSVKTFSVRLNTQGEGVNAVSAVINYPQDLLEVTSVTPSSVFSVQAENTFGGGTIRISRGNVSPVSGTVTVATISVKGMAPGSATMFFTSGSAAPRASDSSDSLSLATSNGTVITVGGTAVATANSSIPVTGAFENTVLLLALGIFLTLFGAFGTRLIIH